MTTRETFQPVWGAMRKDTATLWRQLAILSTVGIQLAVAIAVGSAIGISLDRWLDTSPWFTVFFFLCGVVAGFVNLFRDVNRFKNNV